MINQGNSIRNEWKMVCKTSDAQLVLSGYQPELSVGEHSHNFNLLGMLLFGEMSESIEGQIANRCRSFDIGLQPAGYRHSNRIGPNGLRSVMILFDDSFPRRLGVEPRHLKRYRFFQDCSAVRWGATLYNKVLTGNISSDDFCEMARLMFQLISRQFDLESVSKPVWLRRILNEHDHRRLKVGELANLAGCHPDHFSRAFRQHYGETFSTYRTRARVCRAARMLVSSNDPTAEISMDCGFSDQSHMTRMFNQHVGISPSKLRQLSKLEF